MHCTHLKALSKQSPVKLSNCFFLEGIGKEDRLGEREDKKGTWRNLHVELRVKDQNTEPRAGIRDIGSNQDMGTASSYRFFLVFCSHHFSLLRAELTKDSLPPLRQEAVPFPLGRYGFLRRRQLVASLENVRSQQMQPHSLGKQCEEPEGAQGQFL